ncbi:hypothetical protein Ancab_023197 [Ancistrocladus abbreviatus]
MKEIEVGSVFEVDHSKLLSRAPGQLKTIRAVMVSEKTETTISVMFPSSISLETFFGSGGDGKNGRQKGMMQPDLDEKYVLGFKMAGEILSSKIPFEEFAARRDKQNFWVASSNNSTVSSKEDGKSSTAVESFNSGDVVDHIGLKQWSKRRRSTFIGKQRENNDSVVNLPSIVKTEDDQEMMEEEGDDQECSNGRRESLRRKRKCDASVASEKNTKIERHGRRKIKKESKFINPKSRWTEERYKLAEKNILEVMKAKGAVYGRPMLRPELRMEARKLIGDTGLLDHLLKHMAGKLAPGGKERFRRRHNPEGAMEYWLENAELMNLRKEAGIDDPYWTPPPGWKPGDSPTKETSCAREIKLLKEQIANMNREIEELLNSKQQNSQVMIAPTGSDAVGQKIDINSFIPLKVMHQELVRRKVKIEEKLLIVSKAIDAMEEDANKLILQAKGKRVAAGAAINDATDESGKDNEGREKAPIAAAAAAAAAERTERKQRLKSGFRICKPEGTFLWPDMAASSPSYMQHGQGVVPLEEYLVVHTPPSVSSSTAPPPLYHHCLPSPGLRPVVERLKVINVTPVSTVTTGSEIKDNTSSPSIGSINSAFVPDLNEIPRDGTQTNAVVQRSYYTEGPAKSMSLPKGSSGSASEITTLISQPGSSPPVKPAELQGTLANPNHHEYLFRVCTFQLATFPSTGAPFLRSLPISNITFTRSITVIAGYSASSSYSPVKLMLTATEAAGQVHHSTAVSGLLKPGPNTPFPN